MNFTNMKKSVTLGGRINLNDFVAVSRFHAELLFSEDYCRRVGENRKVVEQWIAENKVMYGVTTGFGSLCNKVISPEEAGQLQHNIIASHSTSVGEPFTEEQARAVMLMVLQNLGQGYSGVRLELLEKYREFLNKGVTPWAPREGSVGYLSPEAHMARVIEGDGKAYYQGELLDAAEALRRAGIEPLKLASKEGLALVSGTTSVTALAALALYDMLKAALSADVIGAFSFEACGGQLDAFCEEVMSVRPHPEQGTTAKNLRSILKDSAMLKEAQGEHLQDCLSLRCIPQLHGAAKKTLYDALRTIETEMNACCDNPIIWKSETRSTAISACNPDSSYVGIEMDSACIAATNLAKISERRSNHLIDESLSGYPCFMVKNPGLNSGLMITQYTQAGLLNEMRVLSTSATIDNTPTCCNQEDYVAMGYNAAKKAVTIAERLEYILAMELLDVYETLGFQKSTAPRGSATRTVFDEIAKTVPQMEDDMFLHPHIETLRDLIHSGRLVQLVQGCVGALE